MELIGSGTDGDVSEPTSGSSVFGIERIGHDAKLADLLDRGAILLNSSTHIVLTGGRAVQKDLRVAGIRPVHARSPSAGGCDSRQKLKIRRNIQFSADGDERKV